MVRGLIACIALALAASTQAQTVTEFATPTAVSNPFGVAPGPDGNVWFTETTPGIVGRITPAGAVTEFTLPTAPSPFGAGKPLAIAPGPDGALWFTEQQVKRIGRVTTSGAVTEYTVSTTGTPQYVTAGPASDGGLWFTESPDRIARISPSDPGTIVEYATVLPATTLGGVTVGPDGNIWFTETDYNSNSARVARLDLTMLAGCSGNPSLCVTEWTVPGQGGSSLLAGITSGPDGAIWFTSNGKVNRITTAGTITQFEAGSASAGAGITRGRDGALWYAGFGQKIGRITTSGALTEIYVSAGFTSPRCITAGPDGNIWFAELTADKIGVIQGIGPASSCQASSTNLCLNAGRFGVEVSWSVPDQGRSGAGTAVSLTGDTGYFWFFNSANIELVIKVLDARGVNGHFWVFYGALSDVAYSIRVTDTQTGVVQQYDNAYHHLASFADTSAFAPETVGPEADRFERASAAEIASLSATELYALYGALTQTKASRGAAPCAAGSETLCLNGGRFEVTVDWERAEPGQVGPGHGPPHHGRHGLHVVLHRHERRARHQGPRRQARQRTLLGLLRRALERAVHDHGQRHADGRHPDLRQPGRSPGQQRGHGGFLRGKRGTP